MEIELKKKPLSTAALVTRVSLEIDRGCCDRPRRVNAFWKESSSGKFIGEECVIMY